MTATMMMQAEGQEEKLKKIKFTLQKAKKGMTSGVLLVCAQGVGAAPVRKVRARVTRKAQRRAPVVEK